MAGLQSRQLLQCGAVAIFRIRSGSSASHLLPEEESMPTLAHAVTRGGSVVDALFTAFQNWRADNEKRAAYRETRAQLMALTDRELDDLGVSRWDIDAVARKSVYGR
jgi:uncharacterized protein YjiS (DUF1127 family)